MSGFPPDPDAPPRDMTVRAAISFGAFAMLMILLVFAMALAADKVMTP